MDEKEARKRLKGIRTLAAISDRLVAIYKWDTDWETKPILKVTREKEEKVILPRIKDELHRLEQLFALNQWKLPRWKRPQWLIEMEGKEARQA